MFYYIIFFDFLVTVIYYLLYLYKILLHINIITVTIIDTNCYD